MKLNTAFATPVSGLVEAHAILAFATDQKPKRNIRFMPRLCESAKLRSTTLQMMAFCSDIIRCSNVDSDKASAYAEFTYVQEIR